MIYFSKIYELKGLKPKNKGHSNFYECCDLTEKVYLASTHMDGTNESKWWGVQGYFPLGKKNTKCYLGMDLDQDWGTYLFNSSLLDNTPNGVLSKRECKVVTESKLQKEH